MKDVYKFKATFKSFFLLPLLMNLAPKNTQKKKSAFSKTIKQSAVVDYSLVLKLR